MTPRGQIMDKLARPPYRFTSKAISEATGLDWRVVEKTLEELIVEGLVHGQNGGFVRRDRMRRTPPERKPKAAKPPHPRQRGFGFE